MNCSNHLIKKTGKYALLAAIFCVFAFLAFSVMAAADENISATETTVIATDASLENFTPSTLFETVPDTSVAENATLAIENISGEIPLPETTTTMEIAPEEASETQTPTLPQETTTTIDEAKQPLIEAQLSSARVVRGSVVQITATMRNLGNSTANITKIEFSLANGFYIFSANYESCKIIEPGSECSFPIELSTSPGTALGKNKIGISVHYE